MTLLRQQHDSLTKANIYNVLFLTALPSMENVGGSVKTLGLREDCRVLVNTSWYRLRGHVPERLCPEAFDVGRLDVLGAMALQPVALLDVAFKSVYQSTAWRIGYLGEIEGERMAKIGLDSGIAHASVSDLIGRMPYPLYFVFLTFPCLYLLCVFFLKPKLMLADSPGQSVELFMLWVCVSGALLVWSVAVLGDGYSDLAKHVHLALNFTLAGWAMTLAHFVWIVRSLAKQTRLLLFAILCGSACGVSAWAATAWPVAVGTLDMPKQTVSVGEKMALTGWVKDPFGIGDVSARVGESRHAAVLASTAYDVDAMFPVSRKFPGRRFFVEVTAPQEPGPFRIDLSVRNALDSVTTFDSLWLTAVDRQK